MNFFNLHNDISLLKKFMRVLIIIFLLSMVVYNIYDNNRVNVVEQTVVLNNLPNTFDDFKILQITDLHEKRFGKNQKKLVDIINKLEYDIIVITGDIVNNDTTDLEPFEELMKGIKKKDLVFFINGNNDPKAINKNEVTSFGEKLEEMGCKLLKEPYDIKENGDTLWILQYSDLEGKNSSLVKRITGDDIKIGLTHYPIDKETYDEFLEPKDITCDLVIGGHYHGGQFRIPFIGALYITKGGLNGIFPMRKEVSGLREEGNFRQYVSRGLGASGPKFLAFRLFNTPEINIITLKSKG